MTGLEEEKLVAGSRSLPLDEGGRAGPGRRSEVQLLGAVTPPGPVLRPTQLFSPAPTALPCPAPTRLWGQEQVPSWGWRL